MLPFLQDALPLWIWIIISATTSSAEPIWTDYPKDTVVVGATYDLAWRDSQGTVTVVLSTLGGDGTLFQLGSSSDMSFHWLVARKDVIAGYSSYYLGALDGSGHSKSSPFTMLENVTLILTTDGVTTLSTVRNVGGSSTATRAKTLSTTSDTAFTSFTTSTISTYILTSAQNSSSTCIIRTPFSPTVPTLSSTTQIQPIPTDATANSLISAQTKGYMPTGTKVAIFLGTILGVVFLILVLWLWRRNSISKGKRRGTGTKELTFETEEMGRSDKRLGLGGVDGKEGRGELYAGEVVAELPTIRLEREKNNAPIELGES
ncbi:hypothetical protein BGZ60DRAFT_529335 [Tricladium varicosporioides]|nr:hypothetical protein BGZ60DRAFT_529335 [Hymenoscyphus varicosporioides]